MICALFGSLRLAVKKLTESCFAPPLSSDSRWWSVIVNGCLSSIKYMTPFRDNSIWKEASSSISDFWNLSFLYLDTTGEIVWPEVTDSLSEDFSLPPLLIADVSKHLLKETLTFPTCDFIWDSSFVVWDERNPNPKISRSYELYRRRYSTSKIQTLVCGISATPFSGWFMGLRNKPPPAVEEKP